MRLAFLGTPDFAVPTLAALIDAGHAVARVYAQPAAPRGRGQKLRPSPVEAFALERGLSVSTPASMRDADAMSGFAALALDAAVVVAYGQILLLEVLNAPHLGCFNLHASLLPRWRGAAPIQRAILAGDATTGVTIMGMERGLDTGPMWLAEATPVAHKSAGALTDELAQMGARMIVDVLARLDTLTPVPQPEDGVTYAAKIDKAEARLDFTRPAAEVERAVQRGNRLGLVAVRIEVAHAHAAEADGGDDRALGAEAAGLHFFLAGVFFAGTLPPAARASDRPIAIACLRLVTFLPKPLLLSVPSFISCRVDSTFSDAFLPYVAMCINRLPVGWMCL